MKESLLTIITTCYNSAATIKDTIASVLNQTYTNIEYILIDGSSTDDTVIIIESYKKRFQDKGITYRWISEPDKGIYDAMNKGIAMAKGKWISFLGSDDFFLENALASYAIILMNINKNYDYIYSKVQVENRKVFNGIWSWKKFRRKMNVAHVGALHNIDFFKEYGLFNTTYRIAGDYELLLRAKDKLETLKLDEVTTIMSSEGISNTQIIETYKETTRAKLETAKVSVLVCKLDYYIWVLKYQVKKIVNALLR